MKAMYTFATLTVLLAAVISCVRAEPSPAAAAAETHVEEANVGVHLSFFSQSWYLFC